MPSGREPIPSGAPRDVPTWTNVLITDDMPIRWTTEPGAPNPGDELTGRLVIGEEDQLIIDLCGTAATNLLAVLTEAHRDSPNYGERFSHHSDENRSP